MRVQISLKITSMKKKVIFVIILGLALVGALVVPKIKSGKKEPVATTKVKRKTIQKVISASGKIKSKKEVELKFQTSGKLAWVGVKEGDFVKEWQAIAGLDKRELGKQLEKSLRDYTKERWDFEQERKDYNVNTDDLSNYTLTNEARRILEKNQFDLEKAVLDVELKDIALKFAALITPISGIVTRVDTPVAGINITPANAVFVVADPNEVVFEANIDEVDISQIKEGQKVVLSLDAYPEEEIESKVEKISFTATTTRSGGTAFPVKMTLPENQGLKFKLGMNGDAEILLQEKENVLVVPSETIMKKGKKYYVFIVRNGAASQQEVKIGLETETETEILEGVSEKEEVVTKDLSKIEEGEKVK